MHRKFKEGEKKRFNNMFLSIEKGEKNNNPDDLVLYCQTNGKVKIGMPALLYMLDFLFDNEDVLYPRSKGFKGRYKLYESIQQTLAFGYEYPVKILAKEKKDKRNRTPVVQW